MVFLVLLGLFVSPTPVNAANPNTPQTYMVVGAICCTNGVYTSRSTGALAAWIQGTWFPAIPGNTAWIWATDHGPYGAAKVGSVGACVPIQHFDPDYFSAGYVSCPYTLDTGSEEFSSSGPYIAWTGELHDVANFRYYPKYGPDPDKNKGCQATNRGDPCNAGIGNEYLSETDYTGGFGVPALTRSYNSISPDNGRFGADWTGNTEQRITAYPAAAGQPAMASVTRSDGKILWFADNNGAWTGDGDVTDTLTQTANGWTYAKRDGTAESYDANGHLLSRTDAAGRTTTYTYDSQGRLSTVTGPFGHTLTYGYDAGGHLATVTEPDGQVIDYTYNSNGDLTQVTYPDGTAKIYYYENKSLPDNVTGMGYEDAAGNVSRYSTFIYNIEGQAYQVEHAQTTNGAPQDEYQFSYISTGELYSSQTTVTDPVGNKEVMTFRANWGLQTLVKDQNLADGKTATQALDANNNLLSQTNEDGQTTTYTYNAANQRMSMTQAAGTPYARTTTYQYLSDALNLPTLIQSPSVHAGSVKTTAITYSGDLPARITESGDTPSGAPVSRTVSLQYNSYGEVTSVTGPDPGNVTTFGYYACATGGACGQLASMTDALGHTTQYTAYDANARLLSMTGPNGLTTTYTYDARGRLASVTQTPPSGNPRVTQYSYDAAGQMTEAVLPDGRTLSYVYDAAHDLASVTDNLGDTVSYTYDLKDNRTGQQVTDPSGTLVRDITTAYDVRNYVASVNDGGSLTQYVHDALGNLIEETDPNGHTQTDQYDALNRLITRIDALSGVTATQYDVNDHAASITAPNGATTTYATDDLGDRVQEQSPDRGTLTYTYDPAGNVLTQTDARGVTATYSYDADNRLTKVSYPDASEDVTYGYDSCTNGIGRLCTVTDESGATSYAYDPYGNVVQSVHTEQGVGYTTAYTYDAGNRITSITYPDGTLVSYTRDALERVIGVSAPINGTLTQLLSGVTYDAAGDLLTETYGNNLTESRTYDLQGHLLSQALGSLDTRAYVYDPAGNLTTVSDSAFGGSYGYDADDRLTQELANSTSLAYGYDANGNRISLTTNGQATTDLFTPDTNRLIQVGTTNLAYDAAGDLTDNGQGQTYSYDDAGRLYQVFDNGALTATYVYNSRNQRTAKTTASGTVLYHYDLAGNLIEETTTTGQMLREYFYATQVPIAELTAPTDPRLLPGTNGNIPAAGQTNSQGATNVLAHRPAMPTTSQRPGLSGTTSTGNATLVYIETDALSTPRLATSTTGTLVWRWEGTAFGDTPPDEDPSNTGTNTIINLRFPGQYYDSETGFDYNWNRYYDPGVGRYITADPLGVAPGLAELNAGSGAQLNGNQARSIELTNALFQRPLNQPYVYVSNDPLIAFDPMGLKRVDVYEITWGVQQYWYFKPDCSDTPGACGGFHERARLLWTAEASDNCILAGYHSGVTNGHMQFFLLEVEWWQANRTVWIYKSKDKCHHCKLTDYRFQFTEKKFPHPGREGF